MAPRLNFLGVKTKNYRVYQRKRTYQIHAHGTEYQIAFWIHIDSEIIWSIA